MGYGSRNLSSASGGERVCFDIEALKNTEVLSDVVGVVGDKAVEVAPVMNEVAVAAAGSFTPVAALQFLVDHVHCYTGYNWWASIAVTTLLLCSVEVPPFMYKKILFAKYSKAEFDEVMKAVKGLGAANKAKYVENDLSHWVKDLEKEYEKVHGGSGRNMFYGGIAVSLLAIISDVTMLGFFFAILNMAWIVPSFATGGTLWFTNNS